MIRRLPKTYSRGFTLLEIMLSMSIFLILVLSYTYVVSFIGRSGRANQIVVGSNLAQRKMEEYRYMSFFDPRLSEGRHADLSTNNNYAIVTQVTDDIRGVSNLKEINISVYKAGEQDTVDAVPVVDRILYYKRYDGM